MQLPHPGLGQAHQRGAQVSLNRGGGGQSRDNNTDVTHVTHAGVSVGHGANHVGGQVSVILGRGVTLSAGQGRHRQIGQVLVKTYS